MLRRTLIYVLFLVTLAACGQSKQSSKNQTQPNTPKIYVSSERVHQINYQPKLEAIGKLQASQQATLSMESSGLIKAILFHSGETVQTGSTLMKLSDDYEKATLTALESELKASELQLKRKRALMKSHSISHAELETAETQLVKARSDLALTQTKIDYKVLKAPFSGKLGFRQVEVGEFVTPGKPIVKLLALDPLEIMFAIPEQFISHVQENQEISFMTDAYPHTQFKARISAIDSETNADNHLLRIKAYVDNHQHKLYPGLFVKLNLFYSEPEQKLAIPKTAINYNLYGNSVFKVVCDKSKNCKAHEQFVKTGATIHDQVIIESGLKSEDEIIISGQLKVHHNSSIAINNIDATKADQKPQQLSLNTAK